MDQRTIWFGGDWRHADFAAALAWLRERTVLLPLPLGEGVSAIGAAQLTNPHPNPLPRGEGTGPPHAILFFQSRPGQISCREVECQHARAPLARLVALVGPWCEGEQRSGRPWPGVVRVPWRTWALALPRALGLDAAAQSLRLPRTAT